MNLFSRLFRKGPRAAAASKAGAKPIVDVVRNDDATSRTAAVHVMSDGAALRALAGISAPGASSANGAATPSAMMERAARSRLAELIDSGAIDFASFCNQATALPLTSVASLCKDPQRAAQAIASIDDQQQFARLVVESPSSRIRQLAAAAVEDPVLLRALVKDVRNKDKSVYKILRQKCDVLNAESRQEAQVAAEIEMLCDSLERHSRRSFDALYDSTLERLELRWTSLGTQPAAATAQRGAEAIARGRRVIADHLEQVARVDAEHAATLAAQETRARELQAARAAAEEVQAQARDAASIARAADEAARAAEEAVRAEQRAAQAQALGHIGGLIRNANAALSDGNTQRAAGLRRALADRLASAPELPPHLLRRLQQLDVALDELKQWKDYAVAPKRTELIHEMESLIGSVEEPPVLAARIKSLQDDWRTISQGIVSDATEDRERFHRASQAAYQPCREYEEAQAKLRRSNLDGRKVVLERLIAFEAAERTEITQETEAAQGADLAQGAGKTDWRLLALVLREAPLEWRRYSPVDREASRSLQAEFNAVLGRLQTKLDAWHERNGADKTSLIKRARQLAVQDGSAETIATVKDLQVQWKKTGPAARDREQSMWAEFRELCDAIFKKRQQAYAEYSAALEAAKTKAIALCDVAEQIGTLSGADLLEAAAKIPELRAEFDALDEMPRADARALRTRFERALDLCESQLRRERALDTERIFTDLFEAGRRVREYEGAVTCNADVALRDGLRQIAEGFVAGVRQWPKGGRAVIEERLSNAGSVTESGAAQRERELRTLCIRSEILREAATPLEDEALRRDYQLSQLMRAMGQGSAAHGNDWDAMALEWVRIATIPAATHDELERRFVRQRTARTSI